MESTGARGPDERENTAAYVEGVRTRDADTGAEKGVKDERHDLIPPGPLRALALHYGMGAHKYAERNWESGYSWSKSYGAAMRHLTAFWSGEDLDPDPFYDRFPPAWRPTHLIAAAWHCFAMHEWRATHPEKDDRPATVAAGLSHAELESYRRQLRQYSGRML